MKKKRLHVQMNADLYDQAMQKAKEKYGVPLSTIIKMYLCAFVSEKGVGFMIADEEIAERFERYIRRKKWERDFGKGHYTYGPRISDLYKF